jgi:hypothetical protein
MAVAAAPYCHGRALDANQGKKAQRLSEAERVDAKFAVPDSPKLVVNNR